MFEKRSQATVRKNHPETSHITIMNTSSRRKTVTATGRKDATLMKIQQMEQERANRRKSMMQQKEARKQEHLKNIAAGNPGDVDFIGMVQQWRRQQRKLQSKTPANTPANSNICIAVRKRPMSDKERQKLDHDSVSCFHNKVWIHSAKLKVDGITKYLTHTSFQFDYAFDEESTTEQIYVSTTMVSLLHLRERILILIVFDLHFIINSFG